jgi:ABC-type Fe3+-hydroxamate transport system substrate-binding protein
MFVNDGVGDWLLIGLSSATPSLQRLQAKIIKTVDVSYGGENGFNQAIELSGEIKW